MSSALCRKAWGTVLWYGKFGFGGRCLNKIFAGRTVLVTVHSIPTLSMRNRRACALQFWADLQKIFSMLQ